MEQRQGARGLPDAGDTGDGSPDSLVVGLWAPDNGHSGRDVEILHCIMDRLPQYFERQTARIYTIL